MGNIRKELQEHFFVEQGMIHAAYRTESPKDILNPYCADGAELAGDDLNSVLEQIVPHLPKKMPVLLEITGCPFTAEEQKKTERGLRLSILSRVAALDRKNRGIVIRMLWFLASFVASSFLLFLSDNRTSFLLKQYLYLPFWFFGYRLITYVFLDLVPYLRDRADWKRLSVMEVAFTERPMTEELTAEQVRKYTEEIKKREKQQTLRVFPSLQQVFFPDRGRARVIVCAREPGSVVPGHDIPGYETLCEACGAYLEHMLQFLPKSSPFSLEFRCGRVFMKEEKETVERAAKTHFAFRLAAAENKLRRNSIKIGLFVAALAACSVMILNEDSNLDPAASELITMLFWFFGDYLIEFILIDLAESVRERHRERLLNGAEIVFNEQQ